MALKCVLRLVCIAAFVGVLSALGVKQRCNKLLEDDLGMYSGRGKNPMQESIDFKERTPEELRSAAVEVCFSIKGLCKLQQHKPCRAKDVQWLSRVIATGDNDCFFLCGKDQFKANIDKMPTETAFGLGTWYMKEVKKNVSNEDDLEELIQAGGGLQEKEADRRFIGAGVLAMVVVKIFIDIGGMAAIGYFSNDRDLGDVGRLGAEVSNLGCFDAEGSVVVQRHGKFLTKTLGDLEEGELVQTVNDAGEIEFSPVYYIAHARERVHSRLLSIQFQEGDKSRAIGLSNRHLIYASKSSEKGAFVVPMMAADLVVGDKIFMMGGNSLEERTVTAITPYIGRVVHPLTYNHHIIVNNVHASVHILNENLYRFLTKPLQWVCWMYPECGESQLVHKLVRFVEDTKEPFAMMHMGETPSFLKQLAGMSMLSGFKSEL